MLPYDHNKATLMGTPFAVCAVNGTDWLLVSNLVNGQGSKRDQLLSDVLVGAFRLYRISARILLNPLHVLCMQCRPWLRPTVPNQISCGGHPENKWNYDVGTQTFHKSLRSHAHQRKRRACASRVAWHPSHPTRG